MTIALYILAFTLVIVLVILSIAFLFFIKRLIRYRREYGWDWTEIGALTFAVLMEGVFLFMLYSILTNL